MKEFKIAIAQICPETGNFGYNAEKIAGYMKEARAKEAGLIVFPECSLTGYAPEETARAAILPGNAYISQIESKADSLGIAVCFGYMEEDPSGDHWVIRTGS